jgi:ketosteroid isomerase-like protein
MSQENVELVKLGFDAFQRRDVDVMREGCHPDVVIVQPPEVPDAKSYEGHAGIAEAFEDWPSQWEDFRMDLVELVDLNDSQVLAVVRQRGRGAHSGIEMDFTLAYLQTFRDGKLARMEMFMTREQALAAVSPSA